jgi:hypothetical protein
MKEEYVVTRKTKDIKKKQIVITNKMFSDTLNLLEESQTLNDFIRIAIAEKIEKIERKKKKEVKNNEL